MSGLCRLSLPLVLAWIAGCGPADPSGRTDGAADGGSSAQAQVRIISLAPALTTTLHLLDAGDLVVGRTPWCTASDPAVPVVWDGASIDAERFLALAPTHCVHQRTHAGHPGAEIEPMARLAGARVLAWRLDRLSDVREMIDGLAEVLGGEAIKRAAALRARLDAACAPDPAVRALGPVALLFGVDPPMAFGPGSYVDDIWRSLGGVNAITSGAYPELTVEELARIDPKWIILVGSDTALASLRHLPVDAVRNGRIVHAAHPGLLEPGAGVIEAVEGLKHSLGALHGGTAERSP